MNVALFHIFLKCGFVLFVYCTLFLASLLVLRTKQTFNTRTDLKQRIKSCCKARTNFLISSTLKPFPLHHAAQAVVTTTFSLFPELQYPLGMSLTLFEIVRLIFKHFLSSSLIYFANFRFGSQTRQSCSFKPFFKPILRSKCFEFHLLEIKIESFWWKFVVWSLTTSKYPVECPLFALPFISAIRMNFMFNWKTMATRNLHEKTPSAINLFQKKSTQLTM
jgi:hypothetical protein